MEDIENRDLSQSEPVGTGPFTSDSFSSQSWRLGNPHYWQDRGIQGMEFQHCHPMNRLRWLFYRVK